MYNQELQQSNLVQQPGSILYNGAPPTPNTSQLSNSYYTTLAPTDTSSYSNASKMSPAALIEMANNVQQHASEIQAQEYQIMTQFQEVMSLLKQVNSTQNTQPLLTTRTMNANQARENATTTNSHLSHANTAGLMEHAPTPVQNATTKQTITMMEQPL